MRYHVVMVDRAGPEKREPEEWLQTIEAEAPIARNDIILASDRTVMPRREVSLLVTGARHHVVRDNQSDETEVRVVTLYCTPLGNDKETT